MMPSNRIRSLPSTIAALLLLPTLLHADVPELRAPPKLADVDPDGIAGALVIVGGGGMPEAAANEFVKLAGGERGVLVVIPTASISADKEPAESFTDYWKKRGVGEVRLFHTRGRAKADDEAFVKPIFDKATAVWIDGGDQSRVTAAYLGTRVEREIAAVSQRGGVVGGTSAGAALMSQVMIAGGNPNAQVARGFDRLPGAVVDQHFSQRKRQERLAGVLDRYPGRFGLGIDEATAVVVRGRTLRVLGANKATVVLAKSARRDRRILELPAGRGIADLTQLRRAAIERATETKEVVVEMPVVPQGSLLIVGGGGLPKGLPAKFIELAGGPAAPIVVLPTAVPDPIPPNAEAGFLRRAGATNVQVLPMRKRADVEVAAFVKAVTEAKGVWFGGGRQWRFVDAYAERSAAKLLHGVLARGGVIGGSSAGATIQGEYLCRGSPLVNTEMMCEGYERGLAFLPGVGIDQHFAQRRRFGDMRAFMTARPEYLGIGIDEATAILVRGSVAEVMGRGQTHFFDAKKPAKADGTVWESLPEGGKYDLVQRMKLP